MKKVKLTSVCRPKQWKSIPISELSDVGYPVYGANGVIGYYDSYNHEQETVIITCRGATCGTVNLTHPRSYVTGNAMCLDNVKDSVDIKYLFYSMQAYDFTKVISGTAQPQITRVGLEKVEITLPSLDVQREIVSILDKINALIEQRRLQLKKLEELVKARFVEMFGNPATPGDKFKTCKLGEVADVKSSHRVFTTEFVDEGVPFYRGTEIGVLASGQRPEDPYRISMEHYLKIASDDSKPIRGDLLLPSICNKGQVWMVDTDEPFYYKDGRVLCISPNRSVFDPRYLQLYMKMRTEAEYPKLGSGSTFAEFKIFQLKKLEIDIPPMDLQNQFAEFVTQIDKSKLLSGCRLFHSWAPENRDKPKHVGVPQRKTKVLRGGRRQQ